MKDYVSRVRYQASGWFGFLDALEGRPSFARWRFSLRGTAVRLFFTCWLVYALHFATNTVREIYPALSLGDHLSFDVSEYVGLHSDIFEMPGRGAFINNNPGASILGAVPYALARPLIDPMVDAVQARRVANPDAEAEYDTIYPLAQEFLKEARARGFDVKFGLGAAAMQMGLMAPMSALSVVVMFLLLASLTLDTRRALGLALLYAFATPIFYRTAQLNHNLLQAHFALFALALVWRPWDVEGARGRPRWLLAGFLAGYTVVLDYSGMILAAGLGLYAIVRWRALPPSSRSQWDVPRCVLGGALAVAILLAYQWTAFGNPIFPAQSYMPATRLSPRGYNGMDWPRLDLLLINAFGLRFGLFVAAPLLLGALVVPRRRRWLARRETWLVLLLTLAFFLFTAANQFSRLQFNSGVRHMVPVVPFLFLLAAGVWPERPSKLALAAGLASIYWSWCQAMYRDVEQGIGIPDALIRITFEGFQ
ncbi:MAG: hypothetical protein ACE5FD_04175, partial [Anaerolineae bacterium]